jgi:hypothetical protein
MKLPDGRRAEYLVREDPERGRTVVVRILRRTPKET